MKLFLKHLLGSIRKRPLQPIILVLTLTLSMLTSLVSFSLQDALVKESELEQAARYGDADFTVTLNSASKSRFMFASHAEEILGERADVVGCYELIMLDKSGTDAVFGVATDLTKIESVFSLSFTERADIYKSDISSVALVSHALAERYNLSLGDSLPLTLFGEDCRYTVGAIASTEYLGSYEVMVDITGAVRVIASGSLTAAALGDDFKPSGTLFVDAKENSSVKECIELLKSSSAFSERTFTEVAGSVMEERATENMNIIVDVAIVLSTLLSGFVAFCCLYILASQRSEENMIFISAGARPWQMKCMQYAEVLIYWIIAVAVGSLVFPLVYPLVMKEIGFKYATAEIAAALITKSAGVIFISSMLSVTAFVSGVGAMKRKTRGGRLPLIISSASSILLLFALVTVPYSIRSAVSVCAIVSVLVSLFMLLPPLMRLILSAIVKRIHGTDRFSLAYALKNLYSVRVLHTFSRLCALLIAIVMSITFVMLGAEGNIIASKDFLAGDFAIMNATERCYEKVKECESAESTARVFFKRALSGNGGNVAVISVSDINAISDRIDIDELPEGDGAILSYGWAKCYSLEIGDKFSLYLDGEELELTLTGICMTGLGTVIIDSESLGIPYNMLVSTAKDGQQTKLLAELTESTAMELAAVVSTDELMDSKINSIKTYLNTGYLILAVAVVFSLTGILDNLYQCYLSRREEMALFSFAGMSKKSIAKMKRCEILVALAFALVVGALISLIIDFTINEGMLQHGHDAVRNFIELFKK